MPIEEVGAIREIERLVLKGTEPITIDGVQYLPREMHRVDSAEAQPKPVVVHTLQSLVDLVKSSFDEGYLDDRGGCFVHVEDHESVRCATGIFGSHNQRTLLYRAVCERGFPGNTGNTGWMSPSELIITLQCHYEVTDQLKAVMKLLGNLKTEAVNTSVDDGVTQEVTARIGVVKLAEVDVPNPVDLVPRRTFPEVAQPGSPFVLRLRGTGDKIQAAIFPADDRAWQLQAIGHIAEWLREALGEHVPVYA